MAAGLSVKSSAIGGSTQDRTQAVHLTYRERQVLILIAQGKTSKEIARTYGIAFRTVISHRFRISKKIAAHNTADFTRWAIRMGLVPLTFDNNPTQPGIERKRKEVNQFERDAPEMAGTEVLSPKWGDLRDSLHDAKLKFDFAYNFLREVQGDGLNGSDHDEAVRTALRAISAALAEYASLHERFISAVQPNESTASIGAAPGGNRSSSVGE